MEKLSALISCMALIVGAVTAQSAKTQASERLLPQWLTGIIAVAAFLFLSFVVFLVKKAWCEKSSRGMIAVESVREDEFGMSHGNAHATHLDMVRSKDDMNAYSNPIIDSTDEKVTTM